MLMAKSKELRKKRKDAYFISDENKQLIKEMLFGPYRNEWRDSSGIVINDDITISERLGIPRKTIANFTSELDRIHFLKTRAKNNIDKLCK